MRNHTSLALKGGFLAHMATVVSDTGWLIPFQLLRGMLWTLPRCRSSG